MNVIECKWSAEAFDSSSLQTFRADYPKGRNLLVTPAALPAYTRSYGGLEVRVCTPSEIPAENPEFSNLTKGSALEILFES